MPVFYGGLRNFNFATVKQRHTTIQRPWGIKVNLCRAVEWCMSSSDNYMKPEISALSQRSRPALLGGTSGRIAAAMSTDPSLISVYIDRCRSPEQTRMRKQEGPTT